MVNISYSVTTPLIQSLQRIEALRAQLLLTPLSLEHEADLRMQVENDRVFYALQLIQVPLVRQQVTQLLLSQNKKRTNPYQSLVLNYKKAFDHIKYDWYVTPQQITQKGLVQLYKLYTKGSIRSSQQENRYTAGGEEKRQILLPKSET